MNSAILGNTRNTKYSFYTNPWYCNLYLMISCNLGVFVWSYEETRQVSPPLHCVAGPHISNSTTFTDTQPLITLALALRC